MGWTVKLPHVVGLSVAVHVALVSWVASSDSLQQRRFARQPPPPAMQVWVTTPSLPQQVLVVEAQAAAAVIEPASTASLSSQAPIQAQPSPTLNVDAKTALAQKLPAAPEQTATSTPAQAASTPRNPADEAAKDSAVLDARPVLLSDIVIEYPLSANNREGVVTLELILERDGKVRKATALKATPPGFFEAAAIKGFQNARFTPGFFQGSGVEVRLLLEVEFMPTNRGGSVAGPK